MANSGRLFPRAFVAPSGTDTQTNSGVIKHGPGRLVTAAALRKKKVISLYGVRLVEGVQHAAAVGMCTGLG